MTIRDQHDEGTSGMVRFAAAVSRAVHRPGPVLAKCLAMGLTLGLWTVTATTPAIAQRLMVPHDLPRALVALVDVRAGALVDGAWIDVEATAIPTPGHSSLRVAERVGDEVWIAGGRWVYRYDAATREFVDSFEMNALVRGIDAQSRRTLVLTGEAITFFDLDGRPYRTLALQGASDSLELRDSMLIAIADEYRVDRYTLTGTLIETFAGPSVPTALGVLSRPRQLALRGNGNVVLCGDVRVYEFTQRGEFIAEYDVGPFEGGVAETDSGRLFVPLGNGIALHDAETNSTTRVGGLFFGQGRRVGRFDSGEPGLLAPNEPTSDIVCPGAVNSTGFEGRAGLLGSPIVEESSLTAFGERLPAGAPTALMMSMDPARLPLSIGTLCLDRGTLAFAPTVEVTSPSGVVSIEILRGPVQVFPITAGSTWFGQLLYRDGSSMRLSEAFRTRFSE